jgi:hypothetical protein
MWLDWSSGVQRPHMQALYTATHQHSDVAIDVANFLYIDVDIDVDIVSYQFNLIPWILLSLLLRPQAL